MTRLDLDRSTVAGTQSLGAAGGLVGVHENHSWFSAEPADGGLRLLKVNNSTNLVEAVYSLDTVVPLTMHDRALWIVDTATGTLGRLNVTDL